MLKCSSQPQAIHYDRDIDGTCNSLTQPIKMKLGIHILEHTKTITVSITVVLVKTTMSNTLANSETRRCRAMKLGVVDTNIVVVKQQ